tara:strand:- start:1717 stop:3138 length:1422 start_codon:yes stop_codon:yes gene_type:complete
MTDINLGVGAANSATGGYEIDNSLKLEADNSENLYRDLNASTSTTKFTHSMWVKRTELTNAQLLYMRGVAGNEAVLLRFSNESGYEHGLQIDIGGSSTNARSVTTRKFRDTSAWYHFVLAVDTTQSTAANRRRLYVNGVEETVFGMSNLPSQNFAMEVSSAKHRYGAYNDTDNYAPFSGYIAECHYVDGSQLDASSFGEFDDDSGIWKPKQYTGSYGTGGYYLDFSNSSALGNNSAGDGTDFTLRNIAAADQATDTPTNNFCTLNQLWKYANVPSVLNCTDGGTTIQHDGSWSGAKATMGVQNGKWYWEIKVGQNENTMWGVQTDGEDDISSGNAHTNKSSSLFYPHGATGGYRIDYVSGSIATYEGSYTYSTGYTSGDIASVLLDMDNNQISFYRNGSSMGTGFVNIGLQDNANKVNFPFVGTYREYLKINFGGYSDWETGGNSDANGYGSFQYSVPSGYYAICTKNLAEYG